MNRIVLIGNGFDLAHGLKTSYKDFIDDYWEGFMNHCIYQDVINNRGSYKYDCIELYFPQQGLTLSHFLPDGDNPYKTPNKKIISFKELNKLFNTNNEKYYEDSQQIKFNIGNKFLLHLLEKYNNELNWVDIENEYYKFLIYQFDKSKNAGYYYGEIKILNNDYNHIKEKLNDYLYNVQNKTEIQKSEKLFNVIDSLISLKDFTDIGQESLTSDEYLKVKRERDENEDVFYPGISDKTKPLMIDYSYFDGLDLKEQILHDLKDEEKANEYFDLKFKNLLILNFNYTDIENVYTENLKNNLNDEVIHIHGELHEKENNNPRNPIIFGYGDELEENYSKLENLNDNAYLENIKSIKYQETDNYKRMLSFINSDKYQVIILGHSCGNSDRTLLNTLFEHENCVSIKPYYFQYKDEKTGEIKDNYSDIVRNISRSFKDKKSMRDKVVNKTYTDWFSQKLD